MALCQEEIRLVLLLLKPIISAVHTGVTSHKYNDPITAANEAYGMHSLTVSTDQKLSAPVYEHQVETNSAN